MVRLLMLIVIVVGGSALTSWLVVSAYVQQVQQALQLQDWDLAPSLSEIVQIGLNKGISKQETDQLAHQSSVGADDDEAVTGRVYENEAGLEAEELSDEARLHLPTNKVTEQDDPMTPWWEQAESEETMASQQSQSMVIRTEDFQQFREQLTQKENVQLLTTIMQRLPQEVIQTLSYYMEDGITLEEWTEIEQLAADYLEPQEWDRVVDWLGEIATLPASASR